MDANDLNAKSAALEALTSKVVQMGGRAESQLTEAIEAVARRDSNLAETVILQDELLDEMEQEIERQAVQVLAASQTGPAELRQAMSAVKIASDLERIGDLAKNVAKRALVLNREEPMKLTQSLARMGRQSLAQLKDVLDAYGERDADYAMAIWRRDEEIDELYNSLFRELLTYMMEDPRTIGLCTHLLFVAKNIERIGDHATNISEIIYYLVHGAYVIDERPKGDVTSLTRVSFDGCSRE